MHSCDLSAIARLRIRGATVGWSIEQSRSGREKQVEGAHGAIHLSDSLPFLAPLPACRLGIVRELPLPFCSRESTAL